MRILPTSKPVVFITMGDPAGIGPEVIAKGVASSKLRELATFAIIADIGVMRANFAKDVGDVIFHDNANETVVLDEKKINVIDPFPEIIITHPYTPSIEGAKKALKCIDASASFMKELKVAGVKTAMVTAPVNKGAIAEVLPGFVGHTEYLAEIFNAPRVTMVLTSEKMAVIPVTRHIPIKEVASALNETDIFETIIQVSENTKAVCGKENARIGVCGLNPHCGESGKVGKEEKDLILPAVERAKKIYKNIQGPIPADVAFYRAIKGDLDIVIGMYHDQCLAPFKMVDFDNGVNMTLGLGFIRTSPDHGTAFDIAGKGIASATSMEQAIKLAVRACG